jgi:hypothetical protein
MKFRTNAMRLLTAGCFLLVFLSCNKDEKDPLVIPASYDPAFFAVNTTTPAELQAQLDQLTAEMKKGRTAGVTVDYATLQQLYSDGVRSLQTATRDEYDARIDGTGGWLDQLAQASGNTWTPGQTNGDGGVYGGYLFDENGVELEQWVQKGLFGAALYNEASLRMLPGVGVTLVDQMVKLFGASPAFKNSDDATKHAAEADKYLAAYAARRDKNDGTGFYTHIRDQFIKLQAAAKAGTEYEEESTAAQAEIRLLWEKANAATVVNYAYASIALLSATNPSDQDKAAALHSLNENVGFLFGWRSIAPGHKEISNDEIDGLLALLNAPVSGTPEMYKFATEPVQQLPKLQQLIDTLQDIYGFSDQEIDDFKHNWVKEQNR